MSHILHLPTSPHARAIAQQRSQSTDADNTFFPTAPPSVISLSPSPLSTQTGLVNSLTVTISNIQVIDTVVSTSSDAPGVASVPANCIIPAGQTTGTLQVTANAIGVAHILATLNGNASATINVVPPGSGTWPNEPAGFTVLTDWPFTVMTGSGWGNASGNHQITSDASAPLSPPNVYQQIYPIGFEGGSSPAAVFYTFPLSTREVYLGFWWRANAGWQAHPSGINKIIFVSREDGGNPFFLILSGQDPYNLAFSYQEGPWICNGDLVGFPDICGTILVQGGVPLVSGTWYRIELYMKMSTTTTSKDGIVRWWANNNLAGNLTTVNFDQILFKYISIVPVWGGSTGVFKTQTDTFSYDHVRVSVP